MNNSSNERGARIQRALVLQGGGSLGAYEAGVVNVLYHWIKKDVNDITNENIFDIIAGTSIGAINAAILTSNLITNKSLNDVPKQLLRFWKYLASDNSINEFLAQNAAIYWEGVRMLFPFIKLPSAEALRRYLYTGVSNSIGQPHVFSPKFFSPIPTKYYNKFYDFFPLSSWWYQYDKEPLKRSISEFSKFGISANVDYIIKGENRLEPRLLLVSVDIDEGATVTFDSYPYVGKVCQICKLAAQNNSENSNTVSYSETKYKYKKDLIEHINTSHRQNNVYTSLKNDSNIHWFVYEDDGKYLFYDNGIGLEHVIASASIPINYEFEIIGGHKFWDGGILSNTPLRELISNHITWWSDKRDAKIEVAFGESKSNPPFENWNKFKNAMKIPDLDVYIVNLHPTKEGMEEDRDFHIAEDDYDMIRDRENDIRFHDKTDYDQKVATMVTDYITLIDKMGELTIEAINKSGTSKNELKNAFNELLTDKGLSTKRTGETRSYEELIKNRFNLEVKFKIERKDDIDTISNKVFDFSSKTITRLINGGIHDSLVYLINKIKEASDDSDDHARQHLQKFIKDIGEPTLEEEKYMIESANRLLATLKK